MAQPSNKLGSVFPGTNRTLACSERAQGISVRVECVEQISGLLQSTPRSSKRLKAISNISSVEAYEYKHTNVNAVDG